jgi:hypothetical protein
VEVRAALARHFPPSSLSLLTDAHQRDAAAVLAWSLLPPEQRPERVRNIRKGPTTEEQKAAARARKIKSWRKAANVRRVALGLTPKDYDATPRPHPSDIAWEVMAAERGIDCTDLPSASKRERLPKGVRLSKPRTPKPKPPKVERATMPTLILAALQGGPMAGRELAAHLGKTHPNTVTAAQALVRAGVLEQPGKGMYAIAWGKEDA